MTMARLRAFVDSARADGTVLLVAILLISGLMGLGLKLVQMDLASGFLTVARFLGRSTVSDLTWLERLSFFRVDLALQLVVIPLLIAASLRGLPRAARAPAAAVIAAAVCIFYFLELQALGSVGRYLTPDMIRDALLWSAGDPDSISDYISIDGALKLAAILIAIVLLAVAAGRWRGHAGAGYLVRLAESAALVAIPAGAMLSLAAYAVPMTDLAYHRSAFGNMVRALVPSASAARIPRGASREDLLGLYRRAAQLQEGTSARIPFGRDAQHDVLLFIIETGPKATHDPLADLESLPGVKALIGKSFVAEGHYTTFPYTSDAVFSMLTGLYPLGRREFLRDRRSLHDVGLIPPLQARGYTGLAYTPIPDAFEEDSRMYAMAGVSHYFVADEGDAVRLARAQARTRRLLESLPENSPAKVERGGLFVNRLTRDHMALDALLADIVEYKRAKRRFVAIFLPQIGHAPWFDLYGRSSVPERGRDVMRLHDSWLQEIVALLAENGWLEETLIVLTSDHGIRTRVEDPALQAGTLSSYSFHVPLMVFAPGTLSDTHRIAEHTSHIDLAPTLHALLGIGGPGHEIAGQGVPLWDAERLARRRLFLFAGGYLGADGYVDNQKFIMRRSLTGLVYESAELRFDPATMVRRPEEAARLAEPIDLMYALQPKLMEALH